MQRQFYRVGSLCSICCALFHICVCSGLHRVATTVFFPTATASHDEETRLLVKGDWIEENCAIDATGSSENSRSIVPRHFSSRHTVDNSDNNEIDRTEIEDFKENKTNPIVENQVSQNR